VDALTAPLDPEQASVKVEAVCRAFVTAVPDTAREPLQSPEAVQLVAFVELQLSVLEPPAVTRIGSAVSVTVVEPAGGGVPPPLPPPLPPFPEPPPPPPQPDRNTEENASEARDRRVTTVR
jgi:hypothetical protein